MRKLWVIVCAAILVLSLAAVALAGTLSGPGAGGSHWKLDAQRQAELDRAMESRSASLSPGVDGGGDCPAPMWSGCIDPQTVQGPLGSQQIKFRQNKCVGGFGGKWHWESYPNFATEKCYEENDYDGIE